VALAGEHAHRKAIPKKSSRQRQGIVSPLNRQVGGLFLGSLILGNGRDRTPLNFRLFFPDFSSETSREPWFIEACFGKAYLLIGREGPGARGGARGGT
jgi:hypothetical protein